MLNFIQLSPVSTKTIQLHGTEALLTERYSQNFNKHDFFLQLFLLKFNKEI